MHENRVEIAKYAGRLTLLLACALVAIKGYAFGVSGSVAVLASLVDSVMDMAVSGINYLAIGYSAKPADKDHRHGHGKIEGLAALVQAILLASVSLFVLSDSIGRLLHEREPLVETGLAMGMMVISLMISAVIIYVQDRGVKQSGSLALEADQSHYSADVIQHAGVILALGAAYLGAPLWIDAVCAIVIALWMMMAALDIARKGVDMILDRELPDQDRQMILEIIEGHPQVLGVHDLRAIRSGMQERIFFDIEADPELTLHEAHEITRDLEIEILKVKPQAEIMIHVDPHGEIEDSRHTVSAIHH